MINLTKKQDQICRAIRNEIDYATRQFTRVIENRPDTDPAVNDFKFELFVTIMRKCLTDLDSILYRMPSLQPGSLSFQSEIATTKCHWSYDDKLKSCFSGCKSQPFNIDCILRSNPWEFCPGCGGEIVKPEVPQS